MAGVGSGVTGTSDHEISGEHPVDYGTAGEYLGVEPGGVEPGLYSRCCGDAFHGAGGQHGLVGILADDVFAGGQIADHHGHNRCAVAGKPYDGFCRDSAADRYKTEESK